MQENNQERKQDLLPEIQAEEILSETQAEERKEEGVKNTPDQDKAINYRGGNLYVSASAGSGKTYVMISRILSHVLKKEAEVNEILCLTFTRAAAQEMREKLRRKITEQLAKSVGEEREYLYRQLRLLPLATVGTIDSFCSALLKSYFFEAGVDPNFEMLSEEEVTVLQKEAIERTVENAYASKDEKFLQIATALSKKRTDDVLIETVQKIARFAQAEKDGEAFYQSCQKMYDKQGFQWAEDQLFHRLKSYQESLLAGFEKLVAEGEAGGYNDKQVEYAKKIYEFLTQSAAEEDFYVRANAFATFKIAGNKPSGSKKATEDEAQWAQEFSSAVDLFRKRQAMFTKVPTREKAQKANELAGEAVNVLLSLCRDYEKEYAAIKEREGKLDYADLEHKTLVLLGLPTISDAVKNRYRYVFVDEYQDVNGVQEEIFSRITNDNMFLVGDIKQSIYGFRGCNPDLFAGKIEQGKKEKSHVPLAKNFRSADGVLQGVNQLFNRIMTEEVCGINYRDEEKLVFGEGYPASEGLVEFCSFEKDKNLLAPQGIYSVKADHQTLQGAENEEGVALAHLIESLIGQKIAVNKKGETRAISYGDIAILFRNFSVAHRVAESLKRRDIPHALTEKTPLTASVEVQQLISLLRLICGSREDIPFLSVLLSPMGKMEESELKAVRDYQKKAGKEKSSKDRVSFYQAATAFLEREEFPTLYESEIAQKLKAVFALIAALAKKAAFLPASDLLEEVCVAFSLRSHAYARRMGKRRVQMINRLIAEGKGADGNGIFAAEFLRRVDEAGDELGYGEMDAGDAVKMMTMHASKGLEFPVVILCGLEQKFSNQDSFGPVLLDRELGVLSCAFDGATRTKNETLHRILFGEAFKRNRAKEEMRLLYVAMTRAKNRLYLMKGEGKVGEDEETSGANNFSKWLYSEAYPETKVEEREEEVSAPLKDVLLSGGERFTNAIRAAREYQYPFAAAISAPEKETVTGILSREHAGQEHAAREINGSKQREARLLGMEQGGRERGVRIHAFMETCDLSLVGEEAVRAAMLSAVERGELLTEDLSAAPSISRILALPLMQEVRRGKVFREREFTMLAPVVGEEETVVQGVIDLLSVADDGIIVVDYKNSALSDEQLKNTYEKQLHLYADAASRFYGIKIKKKAIINLTAESVIEL